MSRKLKIGLSSVAAVCAVASAVVIFSAVGTAASGQASAVCTRPQRVPIAHGRSPEGQRWFIRGRLRNDFHCRTRMLDVDFVPFMHSGPSWTGGYQVPIGGSLSSSFVISSQALRGTEENSFSGMTTRRVVLVEFTTGDGSWSKVRPRRPQRAGAKEPDWLRNVRYFLVYFPVDERVQRVRARDRAGRVLYQGRESVPGSFEDAGVL